MTQASQASQASRTKPDQTPETQNRRARAYAVYATGQFAGVPRSLRSIAQEIGVALKTVQNWRDADRWENRVQVQLDERAATVGTATKDIERLLRDSLAQHIRTLNSLIAAPGTKTRDQIAAIKEFVDIYRKLGVPLPNTVEPETAPSTFTDDLAATSSPTTHNPAHD
jgi:hypothetical protein